MRRDYRLGTQKHNYSHDRKNAQHHYRPGKRHDTLRLCEVVSDLGRYLFKLSFFVVFPDERFHDADRLHVFLHRLVHIVVFSENLSEKRHYELHHKRKSKHKHGHRRKENKSDSPIYTETENECENQHQRRSYRNADNHLICVLNVRNVGRKPCDKARRRKPVDFRKREVLNLIIHIVAQIPCVSARRRRRKLARDKTANKRRKRHRKQYQSVFDNGAHGYRLADFVDKHRHYRGNKRFQHDLSDDENRRENRGKFIIPYTLFQYFYCVHLCS